MGANLGQKSDVREGLALYLDAGNPSSNPISTQGLTNPPWNNLGLNKPIGLIVNSATYSNTGKSSYIELNTGGGSVQSYYLGTNLSEYNFAALNYSIEFWVNRYDGIYILDLRSANDGDQIFLAFSGDASNRLVIKKHAGSAPNNYLFDDDADNPTATDTTWTGWRHYVITREGTGTDECKLYYNGSLVATGTDSGTHITPGGLRIGARYTGTDFEFEGRLGLFKIYNGRALTATEVLDSYNTTKVRYE